MIADFLRLYEATPAAIAHDLHPDYLSTRWAQQQAGVRLIPVQHHHAHLAACLAENGADGPALGVIWDGTGLGTDGTIWGGEFLLGDASGFERVAHLRPFRLPGGEAAVREPRRTALGLLWESEGEALLQRSSLASVSDFCASDRRMLLHMLSRGLNAPLTTSAGRLFDGVAALLGVQQTTTFEGQAAMALEFAATEETDAAYPFPICRPGRAHPALSGVVPGASRAGATASSPMRRPGIVPGASHAGATASSPMRRPGIVPGASHAGATASSPMRRPGIVPGASHAGATASSPMRRPGIVPGASHAGAMVLDWQPLLDAILADIERGVSVAHIATVFHNSLVRAIVEVAQVVGMKSVALSGGCFQNRLLTEKTASALQAAGFDVLLHRQVPPNDGCIALGQVAVAARLLT